MLDPLLKQYIAQAYSKLGSISYDIAINLRKGKNHIPRQTDLYLQGLKMYDLMSVLLRVVYFDPTNNYNPILYRITEDQVNRLLRALVKIGDLDQYPVAPSLFPNIKPLIINTGSQGTPGLQGTPGNDANIIVEPITGEQQINVSTTIISGIKHYQLSLTLYTSPKVGSNINGGINTYEIGSSNNITINITTTKGNKNITALSCISDVNIDAILQPLVNLTQLNGVTQPVVTALALTGIIAGATYTFKVDDGILPTQGQNTINFVYPFLFGHSTNQVAYQTYLNSTKLIQPKGNYAFTFNITSEYAWIGFPTSYGTVKIYDPNGFEVTSAFTLYSQNMASSNLANNWSGIPYTFYQTTLKTTMAGNYTIVFQ